MPGLDLTLASVNASLNAAAAACLIAGRIAIRRGARDVHRRYMSLAFAISTVFLVSYLTRVALTGTHRYPGHGFMTGLYFTVLLSHMVLAAATPFLAIRSIQLARAGRIPEHRRIVKWTFPVWTYVSITGVVVYFRLYHFA